MFMELQAMNFTSPLMARDAGFNFNDVSPESFSVVLFDQ
jgi:hypothetical protein